MKRNRTKNAPLPTVVITERFHEAALRQSLAPHARIVLAPTRAALRRALPDADGLIAQLHDPVNAQLLAHAPRLRVVGTCSVGYDQIDVPACTRLGITVVNTPGVLTRATAELTLTLLLAAARRLPEGEALCRHNRFQGWRADLLLGLELRGRRAVLVGRGRIGTETARLFRAVGLRVQWITREDSEASIRRKLARAQVLSLHFSLNPTTRHWLSRERLALLPPDSIVINTTRGAAIDEKALTDALARRSIFAAGLDVFEREPWISARLRRLPNVVLLPHLGSATAETRRAMAELVISGVLGVLAGKRPPNTVNLFKSK